MKLRLEADVIDMTQPGDTNRCFRPGTLRAYLQVRVPFWLANLCRRCGVAVVW